MQKIILVATLTLLFAFAGSEAVAQCCCFSNVTKDIRGSRFSTAYEELKNSDAVFYGQIVEMKKVSRKPVRKGADDYEVEIKFRVEKAWRRELAEYTTIREYSDGCIIGFGIADRWLVYADFDDKKTLRTGYCTRTRDASANVEDDFKDFEKHGEQQTKIKTMTDNEQGGVGGKIVYRPALGCACVMITENEVKDKPSDEECRKKGDVATVYNGREVDKKAVILEQPQPDLMSLDGASGRVILKVVLCPQGAVGRVGIVAGISKQMNDRAIKAARQIKFAPAMKDGRRVPQYFQLEYTFEIP